MMIALSKEYTRVYDKVKGEVLRAVWECTDELGIPYQFLLDSQAIQESIGTISSRIANLHGSVRIDKDLIRMTKETEKFKQDIEFEEDMLERKSIKSKKKGASKSATPKDNKEGK